MPAYLTPHTTHLTTDNRRERQVCPANDLLTKCCGCIAYFVIKLRKILYGLLNTWGDMEGQTESPTHVVILRWSQAVKICKIQRGDSRPGDGQSQSEYQWPSQPALLVTTPEGTPAVIQIWLSSGVTGVTSNFLGQYFLDFVLLSGL